MSRRAASGSSLTAHRLFAPGMALWFGALFGLSSLAVRTGLFEELVVASRLDQIVPSAAPPLGHAARLLLALAFAVVGGLIGWGMARAIASVPASATPDLDEPFTAAPYDPALPDPPAPQPPVEPAPYQVRARDAHPDAPARRPILAREELRDAEHGRPLEPLARADDAARFDPPVDLPVSAPLPRAANEAAAVPGPAAEPPAPPAPVAPPAPPAVAVVTPVAPPAPAAAPAEIGPAETDPAEIDDAELPRMGPARDGHAVTTPPPPPAAELVAPPAEPLPVPAPAPAFAPAPAADPVSAPAPPLSAAARILEASPASLSHVELIERLAIAMRRREAALDGAAAAANPAAGAGAAAGPKPAPAPADAAAGLREALDGLKDSGAN